MGQQEIFKLLKSKRDWISTRDITNKVEASRGCVSESLRKLYKYGEVLRKQIKTSPKSYSWKLKE
jgi:predicted transcriptional regulator